jgi:hypothetical protein
VGCRMLVLSLLVAIPTQADAQQGPAARFAAWRARGAQGRQLKRDLKQHEAAALSTALQEKQVSGRASFAARRRLVAIRKAQKQFRDGTTEVRIQKYFAPVAKVMAGVGAGVVFNPLVGVGTYLLFDSAQKKSGLRAAGEQWRAEGVARAVKLGIKVGPELRARSEQVLVRQARSQRAAAETVQRELQTSRRQAAGLEKMSTWLR